MSQSQGVLLTGATGALGPALAAEILAANPGWTLDILIRSNGEPVARRFREWLDSVAVIMALRSDIGPDWRHRVRPVEGNIGSDGLALSKTAREELHICTNVIVHAAADTQFMSDVDEQRNINVEGTRRVLDLAKRCRSLSKVILVSTVCTSGTRTGRIEEKPLAGPGEFVNNYERTKWESECVALESKLPLGIARVSIVMGAHANGAVYRPGGFHNLLKWFSRGLVPVIPGNNDTLVDLTSSEVVAQFITRTLSASFKSGTIWNVAAGDRAATLPGLAEAVFAQARPGEPVSSIDDPKMPFIVEQSVFDRIRLSKDAPRDRVVRGAMDSINSFLPMLLYPRAYDVTNAEKLWGGPLPWPDWKQTLERVMRACGCVGRRKRAAA